MYRRESRIISLVFLFTLTALVFSGPVYAGWGFGGGGGGGGRSGLDLQQGYDQNTVSTRSGTLTWVDAGDGRGPARAGLKAGGTEIELVLGPRWYWRERGIPLKAGNSVKVRGSEAQGRDGRSYMIVRELADASSGGRVILRDEDGRPAWAGGCAGNKCPNPGNRGGGGGRGGGR